MAIQIGKIAGIPIALDYSWFVIFVLIAWTIGFNLMPETYPGLAQWEYLFIGVLSSLLLFGSVLVHELAHSIIAKRSGLRISRITLFLFGGVSEIADEPQSAAVELKMSAAGPLTSVTLTFIAGLLWESSVLLKASPLIQAPLQYATLVNAIVAAFNLIPAFPMDGGRVFRSLLWMRNGDILRSTRTASRVGRGFAFAMMLVGIFLILSVDFITGFWLILIGWFISSGAQSALGQTIVREDLRGLKASDIMTRKVDSVSPEITLEGLSQEFFRLKHNGFPVLSDSELRGCVTMDDLRKVKRESWAEMKVGEIMIPREKLVIMREDAAATSAITLMAENRIGRVFVLNGEGKLSGIITRSDILKTVQLRESMLGTGGAGGTFGEMSFTAERGMNFVLEQPIQTGFDWTAEFEADGIQLMGERALEKSEGSAVKQFTFQANKTGKHSIKLLEKPATSGEGTADSRRRTVRTVRYTIVVR